jgi:hypothetical protein
MRLAGFPWDKLQLLKLDLRVSLSLSWLAVRAAIDLYEAERPCPDLQELGPRHSQ